MAQWNQYLLMIILVVGLSSLTVTGDSDSVAFSLQTQAQTPKPSIITGDQLDPTKWGQVHLFTKNVNGEWVSEITARSSNQVKFNRVRSPATDPIKPQSYAADVSVIEAKNIGARARAFIQGRFYKDEAALDRLGDIVANMDIRQPADVAGLEASASVHRCEDLKCDTSTKLFEESIGRLSIGKRYRFSMEFDGIQTFTFKIDDHAKVTFSRAPAVVTAPSTSDRYFGTSIWGIDPIADPVEEGLIKASFDNLAINGKIVQDFNDLNSSEARHNSEVRAVENGKLKLGRFFYKAESDPRRGMSRAIRADPLNPAIINNSVKIEVSIEELELLGKELTGEIRLTKRWYQSTSTKPGGGDVYSEIKIVHGVATDGTINDGMVKLAVVRCITPDCRPDKEEPEQEILFSNDQTFGPVKLNTTHTLSMNWDGNAIVFEFDNQQVAFNATEQAPLFNERPLFLFPTPLIRIWLGRLNEPLEKMSITAAVNNVFIDGEPYDDFLTITTPPSRKLLTSARNTNSVARETIEP